MARRIVICAVIIGLMNLALLAWLLATVRVIDDPRPARREVRV